MKKTVIATISPQTVHGGGAYDINAYIEGTWSSQSDSNSYIECYFQDASDYPDGPNYYGGAQDNYTNWNEILLHVWALDNGADIRASNLDLVCATDGVISGIHGGIAISSHSTLQSVLVATTSN